jgi:hypothetical protein
MLVANWRKAWRWFSVQAMVLAAAIQGAWLAMPPDLRAAVPENLVMYGTIAVVVLGIVGRLIPQ